MNKINHIHINIINHIYTDDDDDGDGEQLKSNKENCYHYHYYHHHQSTIFNECNIFNDRHTNTIEWYQNDIKRNNFNIVIQIVYK